MTVQLPPSAFAGRPLGTRRRPGTELKAAGYDGADGLVDTATPNSIRQDKALAPRGVFSEVEVPAAHCKPAGRNTAAVQMTGRGYYDTVTPPAIRRFGAAALRAQASRADAGAGLSGLRHRVEPLTAAHPVFPGTANPA